MDKLFNFNIEQLENIGAKHTALEIYQQPQLWKQTLEIIKNNKEEISKYIQKNLAKENVRIILTGAGTSAYIGDTAETYLSKVLGKKVESISTTDIVSDPQAYLKPELPTILVSFARSGNSPESVATYDLAEQLVDDLSQIIITCNEEGDLAQKAKKNSKNLVLLMPKDSNDKSFAMTSSFTCMLTTVLNIFDIDNLDNNENILNKVIANGENILNTATDEIFELVKLGYDRVVYLGSSSLKGLAREASLKVLELTSGKVNAVCESVLGFRHGPKSIINDKTLIIVFVSNDDYTRQYDKDLLKELYGDSGEKKVVAVTYNKDVEIDENSDKVFSVNNGNVLSDAFASLNYILYAQIFALLNSIELEISPDNPRPDGTVNRVVKGVIIHKYN